MTTNSSTSGEGQLSATISLDVVASMAAPPMFGSLMPFLFLVSAVGSSATCLMVSKYQPAACDSGGEYAALLARLGVESHHEQWLERNDLEEL